MKNKPLNYQTSRYKYRRFGVNDSDVTITRVNNSEVTQRKSKNDYNSINMRVLKFEFEIDESGTERLTLLRWLHGHLTNVGNMVFLSPDTIKSSFGISIETVRSVLMELEEKDCIKINQRPNDKLTYAQRIRKDDEQDYYDIELLDAFSDYYKANELTAEFQTKQVSSTYSEHISDVAKLEMIGISNPVVTMDSVRHTFPGMRSGWALDIITYLLTYSPNRSLKLSELKEEMKAKGTPLQGVENINEALRKSLFGKGKALSPFIVSSSRAVMLKPSIVLTKEQIKNIENSALISE